MNPQPVKNNQEIFDESRTALGELKAIILKKQEKDKIAAQPNMTVDHLTEEKVLEPVVQAVPASVPEVTPAPMEMQTQSVPAPTSVPVQTQLVDVPAPTSIPVQTQLVDVPSPESSPNYLGEQENIPEPSPSIEDVPAISVGDFSVPNIDMSSVPKDTPAQVPNMSTIALDQTPNVLDTGVVQLPNGTTSDMSNDPMMVVGPESFTKSV